MLLDKGYMLIDKGYNRTICAAIKSMAWCRQKPRKHHNSFQHEQAALLSKIILNENNEGDLSAPMMWYQTLISLIWAAVQATAAAYVNNCYRHSCEAIIKSQTLCAKLSCLECVHVCKPAATLFSYLKCIAVSFKWRKYRTFFSLW